MDDAAAAGTARQHFDEAYYQRFYGRRPVHTRRRLEHLAAGVDGLCRWWGVDVRSVLDVGAGPGWWRDWYRRERPRVRVHSVDVSAHACEQWGHEQRDIATWRPHGQYDLVICHGVLHYLDDAAATSAIDHLAAATRHVLYLEIPTRHDLEHVVDLDATDLQVHSRSGHWYRDRLRPHLVQVGAGLWAARAGDVVLYELEAASG